MTRATTIANSTYRAMLRSLLLGPAHGSESGSITLSEKNTSSANKPKKATKTTSMSTTLIMVHYAWIDVCKI